LEGLRTATKILSAEQVTRELPADSSVWVKGARQIKIECTKRLRAD
jgi:hypothetical protein